MDSLSHKTFFGILSAVLNLFFSLNNSLISSSRYFIPPAKHPITIGTTFTINPGSLSSNSFNFWYFCIFLACSLFYSLRLDTPCLQLGAIVRPGALDWVFLACKSYTFGVPNSSITFNHPLVIVLPNTLFLQVGSPSLMPIILLLLSMHYCDV